MILESKKINDLNFLNSSNITNRSNHLSSLKSELEGSLRFSKNDLDKLKLEMNAYDVEKNTLVIADVSGLHSRAHGAEKNNNSLRIAVHGNVRHLNNF